MYIPITKDSYTVHAASHTLFFQGVSERIGSGYVFDIHSDGTFDESKFTLDAEACLEDILAFPGEFKMPVERHSAHITHYAATRRCICGEEVEMRTHGAAHVSCDDCGRLYAPDGFFVGY